MHSMDRILVIGSPGSGKTTLALKLAERTGLPLVHLDRLFWENNWSHVSSQIFDRRLLAALHNPHWIIDGNFARTLPLRLSFCDTVIYLDYSRFQCLWGVLTRVVTNYGKVRPDMGGNCPERFDLEFLKSVWRFPRQHRRTYQKLLSEAAGVTVHIFRCRRQAARWLKEL